MCPGQHTPQPDSGRRRFLSGAIIAIQGAIGAALTFLLGGAVVSLIRLDPTRARFHLATFRGRVAGLAGKPAK